jgi:hypothetical protein
LEYIAYTLYSLIPLESANIKTQMLIFLLDGKEWKSNGEILTLTAKEAVDIGLASGIAASAEEVIAVQQAK